MYTLFQKSPSKNSLNIIIDLCKQTINFVAVDFRGRSQYTVSMAESYKQYWVNMCDDNPELICNKNQINKNFMEILDDIEAISKTIISQEVAKIYIDIIDEYSKKISNVYKL